MGMSSLADQLTGRTLMAGEDTVAIVIAPRLGGYPDAQKAAAIPYIHPTDLFEPVSLPLKGKSSEYGSFEPVKSLALDLLLDHYGCPNWTEFEAKAFDFGGDGIAPPAHPFWGQDTQQILGLSVYSMETWDRIGLLPSHTTEDRQAAIATMETVFEDLRGLSDSDRLFAAPSKANNLKAFDYRFKDGRVTKLPLLGRALLEGQPSYLKLNAQCGRILEHRMTDENRERFIELLSSLYEFQAATINLHRLNRMVTPSANAGQGDNIAEVLDYACDTISDNLDAAVRMSDYRDDDHERLKKIVDDITRKIGELETKLESIGTRIGNSPGFR